MKKYYVSLLLGFICAVGLAQPAIPYLKNNQLYVDDHPFIMIAGELHNSSASSIPYMEEIWPKLKNLNLNTVLATVTWDQFEPMEGKFDYELIDYLIENAEKNQLKLVVVWFGSWKNGQSSYIPVWVKTDTQRFPRVQSKEGRNIETLSVFSEQSRNADARAFTALMKRIKEKDTQQTVIMVQPENEVGIFQDIDYRKEALEAYTNKVPQDLINYLLTNKRNLKEEVKSVWEAHGSKTSGSWTELFGDNPQSKEFFMAWHYAKYIDYIAESGRKIHDLPMFVNAWIVQKPDDLPGVYPNGGPVSRVMDIYKAAAPSIDVLSPDIYLPNYKEIYSMYYHKADNPLLVPESSLDPARAYYAFAEFDAICFSPFGIEDAAGDILFSESYSVLNELMPLIVRYQGTGLMRGIHLSRDYQDEVLQIKGYDIALKIQDPDQPAFGLIILTGNNEFLVAGMNFKATFNKNTGDQISYIAKVTEGHFDEGKWVEMRWLNGDETYHHQLLRALGREKQIDAGFQRQETNLNVGEGDQFVYSPGGSKTITTPGIYKVILYQRNK
jgi:beta-galactosidase GanA